MHLVKLKQLHSSALRVDEIIEQLFRVEYPGLVLLVSVRHLIGFWAYGEWRLITGFDEGSLKQKHELFLAAYLPGKLIKHATRKQLIEDLEHQLNEDESIRVQQVS